MAMRTASPTAQAAAPVEPLRPPRRRVPSGAPAPAQRAREVVDLERYVPAFLTWIANKLSGGASQHYRAAADVGIETWRCLVLLAIEDSISAQQVSKVIGMDKASVSRCFKSMQAKGLITLRLDTDEMTGRVTSLPSRTDLELPFEEQLVVEYYQR